MPDYGTGSFIIANIADANLVPGIAWVSGDGGTRYGDQSPAPFLRAASGGRRASLQQDPHVYSLHHNPRIGRHSCLASQSEQQRTRTQIVRRQLELSP